jgi:hypothetical protein
MALRLSDFTMLTGRSVKISDQARRFAQQRSQRFSALDRFFGVASMLERILVAYRRA